MKYSLERMHKAFHTYQLLSGLARIYRDSRPKGLAGIAVDDDPDAISYQRIAFRLHRVESYLRGQPTNWFHANWISNEEAARRNGEDHSDSMLNDLVSLFNEED